MRDLDRLVTDARALGPAVGVFAERLLEGPLPWTRMRRVYRLLGLARRYGATRTDAACARALEPDVIDVGLIERMLERATEGSPGAAAPPVRPRQLGLALRFERDASAFAVRASGRATS